MVLINTPNHLGRAVMKIYLEFDELGDGVYSTTRKDLNQQLGDDLINSRTV
jgi:hypothetical protein